jgi:hypothetical protein
MATRVAAPSQREKRPSRQEAMSRIASLVETHMTERGFSEEEKNQRVEKFRKRVDVVTERRSKS